MDIKLIIFLEKVSSRENRVTYGYIGERDEFQVICIGNGLFEIDEIGRIILMIAEKASREQIQYFGSQSNCKSISFFKGHNDIDNVKIVG